MDKLLTVVVPAYNVERYLDQCLGSFVECPAREELEVLVIDDGATDGSLEIAQRYRFQHPDLFRVFHKENGGHGSVINFGVDEARGAYVKVVDGDDWVDGAALAGLIEVLALGDADVVASDYHCVEDGSYRLLDHRHAAADPSHYGRVCGFDVVADEEIMKIHSLTYRTSILRDNGIRFAEGCFYEDAQFAIFPLPFCQTVRYDDNVVYQYRLGRAGQSVDITSLVARRAEHERILESLFALSDEQAGADAGHRAYLDRAIAYFVQNQYQIYLARGLGGGSFAEMRAFDRRLRTEQRGVYDAVGKRSIWLIRKTGYAAFPLGVAAYRAREALRGLRRR